MLKYNVNYITRVNVFIQYNARIRDFNIMKTVELITLYNKVDQKSIAIRLH